MSQPRRTRPIPSRTEPNRSWAQSFDRQSSEGREDDGSHDTQQPRNAATTKGPNPAYGAVDNAYRVIDDYLRQGQRIAESVWLPPQSASGGEKSSAGAPNRMLRAMGELTTAWLE